MTKTQRNARIVRLRDVGIPPVDGSIYRVFPAWAWIAARVSREFPDHPIGESQARKIYKREKRL